MPLNRCRHCGKASFSFARRSYVATCPDCGTPLAAPQDTAKLESEIRERLYAPRPRRVKSSASENS